MSNDKSQKWATYITDAGCIYHSSSKPKSRLIHAVNLRDIPRSLRGRIPGSVKSNGHGVVDGSVYLSGDILRFSLRASTANLPQVIDVIVATINSGAKISRPQVAKDPKKSHMKRPSRSRIKREAIGARH